MLQCILPDGRAEWRGVLLALLPAAALEELLFRSLPLGGLGWLLAPEWLLWPLALCFGLLHWPQGGWGVVGTTLAALALSWLFLATRSIWAPLAAHYVMNLVQLLLAKRLGLEPLRSGGDGSVSGGSQAAGSAPISPKTIQKARPGFDPSARASARP